jgi:hypothetical protein
MHASEPAHKTTPVPRRQLQWRVVSSGGTRDRTACEP